MGKNRIFLYVDRSAGLIALARQQQRELVQVAEQIERDCDNAISFHVPGILKLAGIEAKVSDPDEDDDEDDDFDDRATPRIRIHLALEAKCGSVTEDMREFAIRELNNLALKLAEAADKIATAGGKGDAQ